MKKKKLTPKARLKKGSKIKKSPKKLVVKMSAKAKKPAVKVPTKKAIKNNKISKPAKKVEAKLHPKGKVPAKVQPKTVPVVVAKKGAGKPVAAPEVLGKKGSKATLVAIVEKAAAQAKAAKGGKGAKSGAHSERMCRELSCENPATTKGYCRLDYIKNWKKIKRKEMILKEGKLNQYIEELVSKYPDKYIDIIRQDLSTEVNFNKVIHDLELDESIDDLDYDGDSIDALIGGIKKEIDDFGDEEF